MPNSLSPERKGFVLETRFIVAILAHAICDKGSSMHSFANMWLHSDTLAAILCCTYRFVPDLLFTGHDIVTAFGQRKWKLHKEFGLDGVHQPFALNHCNLYKYEFQIQGRSHYFFYIHQEETTEVSLTRQSRSQTKSTTTMGVIQSPPRTRRSTRATSGLRIVQAKSTTTMDVIISPPVTRRSTRVSSTQAESTTTMGVIISPPEARRRNRAASRGRDGPISKKAKPIPKVNQPTSNAHWFREMMKCHTETIDKVVGNWFKPLSFPPSATTLILIEIENIKVMQSVCDLESSISLTNSIIPQTPSRENAAKIAARHSVSPNKDPNIGFYWYSPEAHAIPAN